MSGESYGGNYDEWGIACPDGEVWEETATSEEGGRSMLASADDCCGCGESPHVLVRREVPEWERTYVICGRSGHTDE